MIECLNKHKSNTAFQWFLIERRYFYDFTELLLIDYRGWSSVQVCFEVFNCDVNRSQTGCSC